MNQGQKVKQREEVMYCNSSGNVKEDCEGQWTSVFSEMFILYFCK